MEFIKDMWRTFRFSSEDDIKISGTPVSRADLENSRSPGGKTYSKTFSKGSAKTLSRCNEKGGENEPSRTYSKGTNRTFSSGSGKISLGSRSSSRSSNYSRSSGRSLGSGRAAVNRSSIPSTPTSVEGQMITWPAQVKVIEDPSRSLITEMLIPEDWAITEFRKELNDNLQPKITCFKVLRADDRWPILRGYEPISYISDCCYHYQSGWAVDIQAGRKKGSSTTSCTDEAEDWQLLANVMSDSGECVIRRDSTASERTVLTLNQIKNTLSDVFYKVFYQQRDSLKCELDTSIRSSLEDCLISLNFWLKENRVSDALQDEEIDNLAAYIRSVSEASENDSVDIEEFIKYLSQILNLVQKLLNISENKVKSKDDNDIPESAESRKLVLPDYIIVQQNPDKTPAIDEDKLCPAHTSYYECDSADILDDFENFLSTEVDGDEFEDDEYQYSGKPTNIGSVKRKNRHKKHDSDCTIIDTFLQDLEPLEDVNKEEGQLNEPDNQEDDTADSDDPLSSSPEDSLNDNTMSKKHEIEKGTEKVKTESRLFSDFVSFIRINSVRLKKSLNKESENTNSSKNEKDGEEVGNSEVAETSNHEKDRNSDSEITRFGFEEICKPAHGMLRKSGSGPITFHRTTTDAMLEPNCDFDKNQTFPRRTNSKFDTIDSGFESCNSSIFQNNREKNKRKKLTPLHLKEKDLYQPECIETDDFRFREVESPNSVISVEAILPALADVSDDDIEEKPQMFFGKFQGKEKLSLKTEKDIYQAQTQCLEFSDSEEEPLNDTFDFHGPKNRLIIATSRSSSSGSSVSKDEIHRMLSGKQDILCSPHDEEMDIIISPFPGDEENLQTLISGSVDSVEMVCDHSSDNMGQKVMTGKIFLWTPDFKRKIKKVFLQRQKTSQLMPEGSVKLVNEGGKWSLNAPSSGSGDSRTAIYLTVETDTERSESVSTTATSPTYDDDGEKKFSSQEELYFNMREQMKTLDQDISHTPNQDDLPYIVIDYMNHDKD